MYPIKNRVARTGNQLLLRLLLLLLLVLVLLLLLLLQLVLLLAQHGAHAGTRSICTRTHSVRADVHSCTPTQSASSHTRVLICWHAFVSASPHGNPMVSSHHNRDFMRR